METYSYSHKVSSNPLRAVYENILGCWREDHTVIRKMISDSKPQYTRKKLNPKYEFFTCLSLAAASFLNQVPEEMPAIPPEPAPSETKPPGFPAIVWENT